MNSLKKSRKNIDAEIMYEMRRQGMTNKQIADQLEVHVSTVYSYIGRQSEAVKHAEVQNKPPVVDKLIDEMHANDAEAGFKPFVPKPKEVEAPPCEEAVARDPERKIHHAGRDVPVRHRHQRRYGGNGRRGQHGYRHSGQADHPAVYRGA